MKKTMIIGLGPNYNYPNDIAVWSGRNNTRFASNHGASLISRTLAYQFDGEYVDDFSNPSMLNRTYDQCILALATHVSNKRDVSLYAEALQQLDMPTFAFSLGVQDYSEERGTRFIPHPSVKRLLDIVADRSAFMGCRGPYTAELLAGCGYKNVIPIGCPTLYSKDPEHIRIHKESCVSPLVVYHRTLACGAGIHLMRGVPLLGQDFLDEVVFLRHPRTDMVLRNRELREYRKQGHHEEALAQIARNGVFTRDYAEWFTMVGNADFVSGPRLHGCIAALIQNRPAVLLARDSRMHEIADFFSIPRIPYSELHTFSTHADIFEWADYGDFEATLPARFETYLDFLRKNGLHRAIGNASGGDDGQPAAEPPKYPVFVKTSAAAPDAVRSDIVPTTEAAGEVTVSVCVQTYNHAGYIRECLDSILMQKTTFPFEIVLGEDESDDGTREVCVEYARRHPGIIRLFLRRRKDVIHIKGRPTGRYNFTENLRACRGKYIAILEGDDFWTKDNKLQRQVDILEGNPDVVCCHHWHLHVSEDGNTYEAAPPFGYYPRQTCGVEAILAGTLRVKARTALFRNLLDMDDFAPWYRPFFHGDVALSVYLGQFGRYYFIDEIMAAYRRTMRGVSSPLDATPEASAQRSLDHLSDLMELWSAADKLYNGKYSSIIQHTASQFAQQVQRIRDNLPALNRGTA